MHFLQDMDAKVVNGPLIVYVATMRLHAFAQDALCTVTLALQAAAASRIAGKDSFLDAISETDLNLVKDHVIVNPKWLHWQGEMCVFPLTVRENSDQLLRSLVDTLP